MSIADLRLASLNRESSVRNRQSPIQKTHPLPRGGTDLTPKLNQYQLLLVLTSLKATPRLRPHSLFCAREIPLRVNFQVVLISEPSKLFNTASDLHRSASGSRSAHSFFGKLVWASASHPRRRAFSWRGALTDYLDGHFARSRGQVTRLGQLLDPIADKLLISAALISLVENQLAPAWAVVIIIGREFAVTGLRSIAATDGVVIAASKMGKFKMLLQVLTVALLIVSSVGGKPPVANFGLPFPAIKFWTVPELRTAWHHLIGDGATSRDRLAGSALHRRPRDALVSSDLGLSFHVQLLQIFLSIRRRESPRRSLPPAQQMFLSCAIRNIHRLRRLRGFNRKPNEV